MTNFRPHNNHKSQRINNIEILAERENVKRFKLRAQEDPFVYKPEQMEFSFYQFCRMHNPDRTAKNKNIKVHEMRKLMYDEEFQLKSNKHAMISAYKLEKFINKAPDHKYTLYETYEISSVDLPSDLELYTANSQILNNSAHIEGIREDDQQHNDYQEK
jgi:hypothetical protein